MAVRLNTGEIQLAHLYVVEGNKERALASARIVGVNAEMDGISLVRRAIDSDHYVIGRELRLMGAELTQQDREVVTERIERFKHFLNDGWLRNERIYNRMKKRLTEMENFLAPVREMRRE